MDGENKGKPYLKWMIWVPLFLETPISNLLLFFYAVWMGTGITVAIFEDFFIKNMF